MIGFFLKFSTLTLVTLMFVTGLEYRQPKRVLIKKMVAKEPVTTPTLKTTAKPDNFFDPKLLAAETKAQGTVVANGDLKAEAGHHAQGAAEYFQFARNPANATWEFGYRRGNGDHYREHHEQGKGAQFRTKVKWADKHGGHGEHYWDYNHTEAPPPKEHHDKHPYDKHSYDKHTYHGHPY